jgi:hypothetical protein
LGSGNIAIVKEKKKFNTEEKYSFGGVYFGERPGPKTTTTIFEFLTNGRAVLSP